MTLGFCVHFLSNLARKGFHGIHEFDLSLFTYTRQFESNTIGYCSISFWNWFHSHSSSGQFVTEVVTSYGHLPLQLPTVPLTDLLQIVQRRRIQSLQIPRCAVAWTHVADRGPRYQHPKGLALIESKVVSVFVQVATMILLMRRMRLHMDTKRTRKIPIQTRMVWNTEPT